MSFELLMPRDAGKFIAEKSKDVKVSDEGVAKTAKIIFDGLKSEDIMLQNKRWGEHVLNPSDLNEDTVNWIFVCDLLNFSFWSEASELSKENKFMVEYRDKKWTGYWAWVACLDRAIEEGKALNDPKFYKDISSDELLHIFRSDTDKQIPMFEERLQCLHQAGNVLTEKFKGSFLNVVKQAEGSAQKLVQLCVENFPSFDDSVVFQGKKVAIYKRVQILVADIWACFDGKDYGAFDDIDSITMFADYRIPQALVWFDVLKYSENLMNILNNKTMLESGSREEVEIRGCTIWAVEMIVEEVKRLLAKNDMCAVVNPIIVDHYLWDYRQQNAAQTDHIPIHRTRCVFY